MIVWADLSATDRDVLVTIGALDVPCGQDVLTFIENELGWTTVSNAHVYPALSRLEARELVTQQPDLEDPRKKRWRLTANGQRLLQSRQRLLADATPEVRPDGGRRIPGGDSRQGDKRTDHGRSTEVPLVPPGYKLRERGLLQPCSNLTGDNRNLGIAERSLAERTIREESQ